MPPPRRGMGPGKIVAIVAGALAGVVVLGGVVIALASNGGSSTSSSSSPTSSSSPSPSLSSSPSGSSDSSSTSAEYRLTVPKSLADGQYTLAKDLTSTLDGKLGDRNSGPNERGMRNAGGQYMSASGKTPTTLVFSGMYGDISDPDVAVESMLKGVGEADGTEVTTPARDITPPGADEPVRCQVVSLSRAGRSGTMPVCAWSDHSTVATVLETGGEANGAGAPDLNTLAKRAAAVRDEVRVKAS
ncbi:hypothetical protein AB0I22_23125 [Streptomyces sp. NPDC050610]|uniref:hypothetical protein n=1 Tax=Streptomyces sp. NPDC050610 TaxID=3157097 RepID=UPI003413F7C1